MARLTQRLAVLEQARHAAAVAATRDEASALFAAFDPAELASLFAPALRAAVPPDAGPSEARRRILDALRPRRDWREHETAAWRKYEELVKALHARLARSFGPEAAAAALASGFQTDEAALLVERKLHAAGVRVLAGLGAAS